MQFFTKRVERFAQRVIAKALGRWPARSLCFIIQPPRITALLELRHDVIGYGVAFVLAETLPEPTDNPGGTAQSEGQAVAKYVPAGHGGHENTKGTLRARAQRRP
jgi:hypothetical protein